MSTSTASLVEFIMYLPIGLFSKESVYPVRGNEHPIEQGMKFSFPHVSFCPYTVEVELKMFVT
jgi:hypothetical protein